MYMHKNSIDLGYSYFIVKMYGVDSFCCSFRGDVISVGILVEAVVSK